MKLFLRDEIFANARTELLGFFQATMDDRDFIELDEDGPSYQYWLNARSVEDREYVQAAIALSMHSSSLARHDVAAIALSDWNQNVLSIRDALNLVRLPYRILVENRHSDRAFLLAIANAQQRQVLEKAERDKNLVFEQGGGIEQVLVQLKTDEASDPGRLRRTFVIVDSDAYVRGKPSGVPLAIRKFCQKHHVPHHILKRRSTENYLTESALSIHAVANQLREMQRKALQKAWFKLRPHQRHHYHMKEGFRKKHHCGLYASLKLTDLNVLWNGWDYEEKETIGYLFSSGHVREHDLLREGAMRELAPMMRKLIAHVR